AFRTGVPTTFDILPSYNVAPQTFQPVVRLNEEADKRELALLRWGLIPFWAKEPKVGFSTINAKSETVATSAMYREPFNRRRCLVPADGFYEWQKLDAKTKQPWAKIHERMPVILPPRDYGGWLAPGDPARPPVDLLRPRAAEEMTIWKVGAAVGNVRNNDESLCNPA